MKKYILIPVVFLTLCLPFTQMLFAEDFGDVTCDSITVDDGAGDGDAIIEGYLTVNADGSDGAFIGESSGGIPVEGAGTRMMWYPDKAAFRAGTVTGDLWNDSNIGDYSIAGGQMV